jgi:hypothetical protein
MHEFHITDDIALAIRVLERIPVLLIMGAVLVIGLILREL